MDRPSTQQRNLLIVGMGMAGYGLCDRLCRVGALEQWRVTILGEEPTHAYDRVNLSKMFDGKRPSELLLASEDWYHSNKIVAETGRRAVHIDRERKTVEDNRGQLHPYDHLVLATGSSAWVPPVEGLERSPGVFVYRTFEDLLQIKRFVESHSAKCGAVIGGGLLGLEAAKALTQLGVQASIIEMAPGLMPRQLDAKGAERLRNRVEALGVDVHLVRRTRSVSRNGEGRLQIAFTNAEDLTVDILIVAAGIRPNDQLADQCALKKGPRGGFEVSNSLSTSDPDISAIGECASFRGHLYGLVAPCFRMADVLAERLAGLDSVFDGADESAELKLMGVQVVTLGRVIGDAPGVIPLTHQNGSGYRKLLIEQGRIVGASCVGPWEELPQVRRAINRQQFIWPWQRARFQRTGSPWAPGGTLPIHQWPDDSVVCSCLGVTKSTITRCATQLSAEGGNGATPVTAGQLAAACGASSACGSCRPLVEELAGTPPQKTAVPGSRVMFTTSVCALAVVLAWLLFPAPGFAESVRSGWRQIDTLWRSDLARQVTGYSLLGTTGLGMLFSLRKRFTWFKLGTYGNWRAFHGVLGTAALLLMAVHTGIRLGSNLNFMLGVCFLATIAVGALAGISSSMETRLTGTKALLIRTWRSRLAKAHLWITWPLPVLIAIHVLSFYWFSD